MKKDLKTHIMIKPEEGSKLKYKKEETDRLPADVGVIFKSKEEVKEEREFRSFKDFLK